MPNAVHSFLADMTPASTVSETNLLPPISLNRLRNARDSSIVHEPSPTYVSSASNQADLRVIVLEFRPISSSSSPSASS